MKQVCFHGRWTSWCGRSDCISNGVTCVCLTATERVVCWHTGFQQECNQPSCCDHIDGEAVVIKDRGQSLQRIDGAPLRPSDRQDDEWHVRIHNDPFQLGKSTASTGPYSETALVIMDMWDRHPGTGTSLRATQMAPVINEFANFLRSRGALIIHSPSERGVYAVGNPLISAAASAARQRAITAHDKPSRKWARQRFFYLDDKDKSETFDRVIERCGEEWPTEPNEHTGQPTFQSPAIEIRAEDAISATMLDLGTSDADAYPEMLALTEGRPNIIYCGINTNMCILARPNSMRTMAKAGKSLWLVRDLTDASVGDSTPGLTEHAAQIDGSGNRYRNQMFNHFEGTDLVVDWIGRNVGAETWTSDVATGQPRFRYPGPFGDNPARVWPRPGL